MFICCPPDKRTGIKITIQHRKKILFIFIIAYFITDYNKKVCKIDGDNFEEYSAFDKFLDN